MNPENPNNHEVELTTTPEQWADLKKRAEDAEKFAKEQPDKITNSTRTINGLANRATPTLIEQLQGDDRFFYEAQAGLEALDKYTDLLEEYPHFAEKERSSQTGYFPDLEHVEDVEKVFVMEERLKSEAEENE